MTKYFLYQISSKLVLKDQTDKYVCITLTKVAQGWSGEKKQLIKKNANNVLFFRLQINEKPHSLFWVYKIIVNIKSCKQLNFL